MENLSRQQGGGTASAPQRSRFLSPPAPSTSRKRRRVEEDNADQGGMYNEENNTDHGGMDYEENNAYQVGVDNEEINADQVGVDNEHDNGGDNGTDGERNNGGNNERNNGDDDERNNGGGSDRNDGDESDRDDGGDSEHEDDPAQTPPSHAEQETEEVRAVCMEEIKIAYEFSQIVKTARLGDAHDGLDDAHRERLRNPPQECLDITDPDIRLSLDLYLAMGNASQQSYKDTCQAVLRRFPNSGCKPLSYYQIQRHVDKLSGVVPIVHDMCINTCIAFTGPWSTVDKCPKCQTMRYDPLKSTAEKKVPRQRFYTIPLGPQLQALWRTPEGAEQMRYRQRRTNELLAELNEEEGVLGAYDDILCGSDYLSAVQEGVINEDDMVLMFSIDGAQLYEKKASDCWIYIWILVDHSPDRRYKKRHILPGGFIPGPKKPKNLDSFIFVGLHHLSALQAEGLRIWDAARNRLFTSYLFLILGCADSPAMALLSGLVGHHGKNGCRLSCPLTGRHKDGAPHYFPVRLKPLGYTVDGCSHADVPVEQVLDDSHQMEKYRNALARLSGSINKAQYDRRRLETGICKPSIFSGIPRSLGIPRCFSVDIMHLLTLNIPELLLKLWRGTLECDDNDNKATWAWAVLTGDLWKAHGKAVASAKPYLPGSFDRPPRNPVEKINSGYKAMEYLNYFYVLGPAVFYDVLPLEYWRHFCKLVYGVRIIYQKRITTPQLCTAHAALVSFANDFELLYYQRKDTRIHMVRMSIHLLYHLAPEVRRVGPGICSSQYMMEREIGILGREIKQHSSPYANLSRRGLRQSQVNALTAMIPDICTVGYTIPRGGLDLGDGFVLLGPTDDNEREATRPECIAIENYLLAHGITGNANKVIRRGRLRLSNGQIARCVWAERTRSLEKSRMARAVKVCYSLSPASANHEACTVSYEQRGQNWNRSVLHPTPILQHPNPT
jgi:hypothetical protein